MRVISPLGMAIQRHKPLYLVMLVVAFITALQSVYIGVPLADFSDVFKMLLIALLNFLFFVLMMAVVVLVRVRSFTAFKKIASSYTESQVFAHGLVGMGALISVAILFIIQKCFVNILHPFGFWDPIFIVWDKALHFGRYPHEFIVQAVDQWPILARVMDISYTLWFPIVFWTGGYALFCDTNLRRRMHFLWVYILTFIVIGGATALAFSTAGPVFFGDFFLNVPNPYKPLVDHLDVMNAKMTLGFVVEREWLLYWTNNDQYIDMNSIAAMPSMHNAKMLFCALYLRSVNRFFFWLVAILCVPVFFATIYCGFHYALDAYVGYGMVLVIWFGMKGMINRLYPDIQSVVLNRQQV